MEFFIRVLQVGTDGLKANPEQVGDFLINVVLPESSGDFQLAGVVDV